MAKYIFKRLVVDMLSLSTLITTTLFLMHVIPRGPFSPPKQRNVSEKILEQTSGKYGLNNPLPAQYIRYLGSPLHGDMGASFKKQDTTVNKLIASGFPVPVKVGTLGIAVALAAGVSLGTVTAMKRGKLAGGASMVLATTSVSVFSFVLCVLVMYVFCEKWKIFPFYGLTSWRHYVLLVLCVAFSQVTYITRLIRFSTLKIMRQDYIRTECFRGVPEWEVTGKYALKNSVLPMATYVGPLVAALLTDIFIIEKLFSIPGLGRYFIFAITDRDYFATLELIVFLDVTVIGCNLIAGIIYAVIDSRIETTE